MWTCCVTGCINCANSLLSFHSIAAVIKIKDLEQKGCLQNSVQCGLTGRTELKLKLIYLFTAFC